MKILLDLIENNIQKDSRYISEVTKFFFKNKIETNKNIKTRKII